MAKNTNTANTTTAQVNRPTWGTRKSLDLVHGQAVLFHGANRTQPKDKGVPATVRVVGSRGVELVARGGKVVWEAAPAGKFWVALPQDSSKPATKATNGNGNGNGKAASKAAPAKAASKRTQVQVPAHPGEAWLEILTEAGLSQTEAATLMGIAPMTLNRLINGKGIPTAKVTVLFAHVTSADVREIWQAVCDYELALALAAATK